MKYYAQWTMRDQAEIEAESTAEAQKKLEAFLRSEYQLSGKEFASRVTIMSIERTEPPSEPSDKVLDFRPRDPTPPQGGGPTGPPSGTPTIGRFEKVKAVAG